MITFRLNDGDIIPVLGQPYEVKIGHYPQVRFAGPHNRGACLEGEAIYLHPDATIEDLWHELTHATKYEILVYLKLCIEDAMYEEKGGE